MPLPDEIVLKNCYYWASKFVQRGIDFDELVSIGYLCGKPLTDARLLKTHMYYNMLHHVQREKQMKAESFLDIPVEEDAKDFEQLYLAIKAAKLSEQEMESLVLYFFKDYKQIEIAEMLNITQPTVACYIRRAIKKIRNVLEHV